MKKAFLKGVFLISATVISFGYLQAKSPDQALLERARQFFQPIPSKLEKIPYKDVKLTNELVELGKYLYFDPRLSASHLISCNTCHNLALGGTDNLETSIGHAWQKGSKKFSNGF